MLRKRTFIFVAALVTLSLLAATGIFFAVMGRTFQSMEEEFSRQITSAMEKAINDERIIRNDDHINPVLFSIGEKVYSFPDSIGKLHVNDIRSVTVLKFEESELPEEIMEEKYFHQNARTEFNILIFRLFLAKNIQNEGIRGPYSVKLVMNRSTVGIDRKSESVSIMKNDSTVYSEKTPVPDPVEYIVPIHELQSTMECILEIGNPNKEFIRQTRGITVSLCIVVLTLCLSFIYLIYTVFRQKSIEEMRQDFTHNITHELKTPIATARAVNEVLLDFSAGDNPSRRKEYLTTQRKSLDSLSEMVENILAASLQESDSFRLHPEKCDLREIVEEQVTHLTLKYGEQIRIRTEIPENAAVLHVDRFHFSNVISNILDNAVKYSIDDPEIDVKAYNEGKRHRIEISDRGPGIPISQRRRIFEKYYRIPTGDIHNVRGSGIGLYYCKLIVNKSGGRIFAGSAPGGGSTFTILI